MGILPYPPMVFCLVLEKGKGPGCPPPIPTGSTCAAHYFCGEYTRNALTSPPMAPKESKPIGRKIFVNTAPCHIQGGNLINYSAASA